MIKEEMTVNEWLNNEELPITIWKNKYQQNNETFEQWLDRVSGSNEEVKELIRDKKFIFGGRILSNRGIKGRSLTYSNCFTGDTKIMTDNGLKTLKECYDKGAKINVLSKTAWRTAEVKYFGVQPIKELTLRKGSSVRKFYVTGNHQWFVKNKKSGKEILKITDELCVGDVIPTEVMKCYRTYKPNPIGVAHGFFTGDGDHAEKDNCRVNICKGKEDMLPYYMPDTLGHSGEVITVSGMPKFFSHYPSLQESKSYLYGWLAGYFAADGSIDERGACVICSTKIKDLEYVQNVLCVLGIPSSEIRCQDRISNLTGEEGRVHILSLNKKYLNATFFVRENHRKRFVEHPFKNDYDWRVDKVVDMGISSPVYCAVVPETQSFTLDGGIKTHNCYVIAPPEDNLESIFETGGKLARTFSYGGGCGIDISKLRPKGASVNNAAKSTTGTTSFMDFYSYITSLIGQAGRRGALMISISCEHPDLIEFINLKSDLNVCTKANISVRVTDAFMKAVENNSDFTLHFTMEDGSEIKKTINAREVFMLLAKKNWEMAEPGMLYWDRISNYNLLQNSGFKYAGVNPCVTGDTPILTDKGHIAIKSLVGKKVRVWNGYEFSEVEPRITGTNQEIVDVELSNGRILKCTPYHKFILADGKRVHAADLKSGDKLIKHTFPVIEGNEELYNAYTQGVFSGDGFVCKGRNAKYISLYGDKKNLVDKLAIISQRASSDLKDTFNIDVKFNKTFVPTNQYTIKSRLNWLAGLIDTDGFSDPTGNVSITSINEQFLLEIQLMIQTLGCESVVTICHKESYRNLPDGAGGHKKYHCCKSYRLLISSYNIQKLIELGLACHRVSLFANPNRDASRYIYVKSVTKQDKIEDKVYCFNEPINHSGIFNGIITAQCAEEPLPAGGSCLLGSINLSEFVVAPFTDEANIDYKSLASATRIAVRALNDVLMEGLPLHPLQEQRESVQDWRQIGLGTLGLGDMLIMLGLKYGSIESLEVIEKVYKLIATESIFTSLELAKKNGAFPKCLRAIKQAIISSDFVRNLELPLMNIDEIQRNGLYNSQLLTCAPTGSIGTMLQVSTGVEPNYAFSYKRRTVSLNNEETTYNVDAKIVSEYKRITGNDTLPDYFVSASDIHYKDRIKVQSVLQRYIDASISSTINLPNDTTVEQVADIYMKAWKQGLKGVTIWRDGCQREGILSTGKKEDSEKKQAEEKKPIEMNTFVPTGVKKVSDDCIGRKRTLVTGCGTLHLTAFFCRHNGQLLETYFSKGSQGGCALFMVGLSRMVSLAARANVSIEMIVDQLLSSGTCPSYAVRRATKKDTSKGSSCPVAIGFALMDMYNEIQKDLNIQPVVEVKDDSHSAKDKNPKCPKCGEELSMVEGCMTCSSCGYSKCN